ncbi:MAG: VOC family protein [Pyrinomonadaceae bacterium]
MPTINPYLSFNGNAEEAFNFYRSVFGGDFETFQRFADIPAGPDETHAIGEDDKQKIMHVSLPIGEGSVLMGSDVLEAYGHGEVSGNNMSIAIATESREETERIFNGLSDGGEITMPLNDTFWGAYFGMFTDKFGIQWMVNFDQK